MRPAIALALLLIILSRVTPAPAQIWWCPAARAYYPQVQFCQIGTWVRVGPAAPVPPSAASTWPPPAGSSPPPPAAPLGSTATPTTRTTAATIGPNSGSAPSARADQFDAWCKTIRLPSSIAICSEPDLRALASERQEAYNEARARLSPEQQRVLLADQNGWVHAYAAACGLSDASPLPLPPQIKDCMTEAGRARIAYLRAYGATAPGPHTPSQPSTVPAGTSQPHAPVGSGLSASEMDMFREQISRCWNLPATARDGRDLVVEIRVVVSPGGNVEQATIVDQARAAGDPFYRAVAESARRAFFNPACRPLNLPADKYAIWRGMVVDFSPKAPPTVGSGTAPSPLTSPAAIESRADAELVLPSWESGNYSQYCSEQWTKRGVLNEEMYRYCLQNQKDGYDQLTFEVNKYKDLDWLQAVIDEAVKTWTKRGARQDEMVEGLCRCPR